MVSPPLYQIEDRKKEMLVYHGSLTSCKDRSIPVLLRQKRHQLLEGKGPVLEETSGHHPVSKQRNANVGKPLANRCMVG